MAKFPMGVWGQVADPRAVGGVEAIKAIPSDGGGFLILTIEDGAEYDVWVETLAEVEHELAKYTLDWPTAE